MSVDIGDMRQKWELYAHRLKMGHDTDGSLAGASYIIATTATNDIPQLLDMIEALQRENAQIRGAAIGPPPDWRET